MSPSPSQGSLGPVWATLLLFTTLMAGAASAESGAPEAPFADRLPPVAWNASLDAGPVSTKPLVTSKGIIVVKIGGDPQRDIPGGLRAFAASNGTPLWSTNHSGSTLGFEVAPLLLSASHGYTDCWSPHLLVITGWTDGVITAHHLATGALEWSVQTERTSWGVTSDGRAGANLWMLAETAALRICEANGTVLDEVPLLHDGVAQTVYRSAIGGLGSQSDVAMIGSENATLHLVSWQNATQLGSAHLPTLANLSGEWRVRSRAIWSDASEEGLLGHVMVQASDGMEGRMLLLNVTDSYGIEFWMDEETSSLTPLTFDRPIRTPAITQWNGSAHAWGLTEDGLAATPLVEIGAVTGEIGWAAGGLCLPINEEAGGWMIWNPYLNESVRIQPDRAGWLTAGCGSFGMVSIEHDVLALANDASWLEVRLNATIGDYLAGELEELTTPPAARVVEIERGPGDAEEASAAALTEAAKEERFSILFGLVVTTIGATFVLWGMAGQHRLKALSALWLVALLVALPALDATVNEATTDLVNAEGDPHDGLPSVWHDNQVVCFLHPVDLAPPAYADGLHHVAATGDAVHTEVATNASEERGICIGGIHDATDVAEATEAAAAVAGLGIEYERYAFGDLLVRIGDVDASEDNRHWLFWVDGSYATRAADRTDIGDDGVVVWRYMTEAEALGI